MERSESSADIAASPTAESLPPGHHPLEIAARRGIGPLSSLAREKWHGFARPCVSCGQLVLRDAGVCDDCGQELSTSMVEKMRAHAGPWYVLEHVRPFPGVSLERIIRQIRRGVLTETSIIRGPATDHQWRFAVETPGLCRYFSRCWSCHAQISPSDTYCGQCRSHLSFEKPKSLGVTAPLDAASRPAGQVVADAVPGLQHSAPSRSNRASPASSDRAKEGDSLGPGAPSALTGHARRLVDSVDLGRLSAAVDKAAVRKRGAEWDQPPRVAGIRATWIALVLLALVLLALIWIAQSRGKNRPTPTVVPAVILL